MKREIKQRPEARQDMPAHSQARAGLFGDQPTRSPCLLFVCLCSARVISVLGLVEAGEDPRACNAKCNSAHVQLYSGSVGRCRVSWLANAQ